MWNDISPKKQKSNSHHAIKPIIAHVENKEIVFFWSFVKGLFLNHQQIYLEPLSRLVEDTSNPLSNLIVKYATFSKNL